MSAPPVGEIKYYSHHLLPGFTSFLLLSFLSPFKTFTSHFYLLFNFFFCRLSGIGNSFPRGTGHSSDEPGRTHTARHGGNVTGASPPPLPLIHMPLTLFAFPFIAEILSLLDGEAFSSRILSEMCSSWLLVLDVIV